MDIGTLLSKCEVILWDTHHQNKYTYVFNKKLINILAVPGCKGFPIVRRAWKTYEQTVRIYGLSIAFSSLSQWKFKNILRTMEEGFICLLSEFLSFNQNALVTQIQKSILDFTNDSPIIWSWKEYRIYGTHICFLRLCSTRRGLWKCFSWNGI